MRGQARLSCRLLRALHETGATRAVGTDTPNPLAIPGFSVREERANFVTVGFNPREALTVATRVATRLPHSPVELRTVKVGKRADPLLLVNDLWEYIRTLRRPAGVLVRGTWLPAARLDAMLRSLGW